jgi:hypothetical protein
MLFYYNFIIYNFFKRKYKINLIYLKSVNLSYVFLQKIFIKLKRFIKIKIYKNLIFNKHIKKTIKMNIY